MRTFAAFILRHKALVVLTWLAAVTAGVLATAHIGDRLTGQLDEPGQPAYETNQKIIQRYGGGGDQYPLVPVVTLPAGQRVDDPANRVRLAGLFDSIPSARVVSYANTGDASLIVDSGRTTFGLVFPAGGGGRGNDRSQAVESALRKGLPPGWTVQVTGMDVLESGDTGRGGLSVLAETLIGALGALAVLAFVFGSLLAFVPLVIAGGSILTCFLALYGLTEVTSVSGAVEFIVALIGLGVAIDYSLLLVTRWREEFNAGRDANDATIEAMATAGRAVVLSGLSVAVGLLAMVVLPVPFLRGIGYGGVLIPVCGVAAVLTLLPVLLATIGPRLDWPGRAGSSAGGRLWRAFTRRVIGLRWPVAIVCLGMLGALAVAGTQLRLGDPESASLARSGPAFDARQTLVAGGVGTGALTPIEVLVADGVDPAALARRLAPVPGVRTALAADGSAVVDVLPVEEGRVSVDAVKAAVRDDGSVGGPAAQTAGFIDSVYGAFPFLLGIVALVTLVVLVRGLRSIVLPLKAIALNLLSLGAIFGAVVLVWQDGYGSRQIWGIEATGSITEFIPVLVFAFLYGLSMDYEVFILTRIREEYERTADTRQAIVEGIGHTGKLVTSAALVLFLAFASLASAPNTELKVFATGLGLGILLDATVIRALLVPALMAILGRWNWWLPGWFRPRPVPPPERPAARFPGVPGR
jgi:RND superfamily putative drug exporter